MNATSTTSFSARRSFRMRAKVASGVLAVGLIAASGFAPTHLGALSPATTAVTISTYKIPAGAVVENGRATSTASV